MQTGIYQIINITTSRKYIGSSFNIEKRWSNHKYLLKKGKHPNIYLQHSWNKYGEQVFKLEILELCIKEDLTIIEQYYLDWLEPFGQNGYNIAKDAEVSSRHMSQETRAKISAAGKGRIPYNKGKPMSREQKEKISLAKKGCVGPNKGKKFSTATRAKMSMLRKGRIGPNKGKPMKEATKEKLRLIFTGKKMTEEAREKNRQAHTGAKNYNFGKTVSEETKQKISLSLLGRYKGEKNPFFGKKHTEETRKKIRESIARYKLLQELQSK